MCAGGLGKVRGEVLVLAEGGVRVLEVLLGRREGELLVRDPRLLVVALRPAGEAQRWVRRSKKKVS